MFFGCCQFLNFPTNQDSGLNKMIGGLEAIVVTFDRQNQMSAMLANSLCIEHEVPGYCPPNCATLVGQIRVLHQAL